MSLWFRQSAFAVDGVLPTLDSGTVLQQSKDWLAVRFKHGRFDAVFVCLHAPHSGYTPDEIGEWWRGASDKLDAFSCLATPMRWSLMPLGRRSAALRVLSLIALVNALRPFCTASLWWPSTPFLRVRTQTLFALPSGRSALITFVCRAVELAEQNKLSAWLIWELHMMTMLLWKWSFSSASAASLLAAAGVANGSLPSENQGFCLGT